MENSKINTANIQTINSTIFIGALLRNGGNRLFTISNLTEDQVVLKSLNGEATKYSVFSRNTFCKLYFMRNYTQVTSVENFTNDMIDSRKTGADRFLVK